MRLAFVLLVALAARLVTFAQIHDGPTLHLHGWTQSDMHFFDRWARAIAAGDLLTHADMRPYHERHRTLACAALARSDPATTECDDAAIARIWDGWVGKGTLWQDPLYPYLLAAEYATLGRENGVVYAVHALGGIGCVGFVHSIAAALFGPAAALVSGLLAALYGPLMFFETLRLREVALTLAGLGSVRLTLSAITSATPSRWLAVGVAGGACVLLKASSLAFVGMLPIVAATVGGIRGRRLVVASAAFAFGVLVTVTPLAARNLAVGLPAWSVASTGPINFLNGNAVDHDPAGGSAVSEHALDILIRTQGRGGEVVAATIATHGSTSVWMASLGRKFVGFWRATEVPNNASFNYFLLQSPWLSYAAGFWLVAPLALVGFVVGLRSNRSALLLLLFVASHVAVCVVFFNVSRFRLPAAVGMIPFAGLTLVWLIDAVRALSVRRLMLGIAGLAVSTWFVNSEAGPAHAGIRLADYGVHNRITEQIVDRRLAAGDTEGARAVLERQIATEPAELREIEPGPTPARIPRELSGIAGTFTPLYERAARVSAEIGDEQSAARMKRRAAVLRALNAPYVRMGDEGTR